MGIAYLLQKSHAKAVIISELLVKVYKLWTIQYQQHTNPKHYTIPNNYIILNNYTVPTLHNFIQQK